MFKQYTVGELAEFAGFCKAHGITFGSTLEMRAALDQYFLDDSSDD